MQSARFTPQNSLLGADDCKFAVSLAKPWYAKEHRGEAIADYHNSQVSSQSRAVMSGQRVSNAIGLVATLPRDNPWLKKTELTEEEFSYMRDRMKNLMRHRQKSSLQREKLPRLMLKSRKYAHRRKIFKKEIEKMKKIINAKMYNTETAQRIGYYSNGMNYNDFCFVEETLYRKKNGEFFLEGHGGAKSRYARSCGNQCWSSGEDIVPLNVEEAKEWVERHCSADVYIETFGNVEE